MALLSDEYVHVGAKRMRRGFTSGTAAALAARAACGVLLGDELPATVRLLTPAGVQVEAAVEACGQGGGWAACGVRKDGGDDADATDGLLIVARVARCEEPGIRIEGGEGVGRVTLPGLEQPPGAAAINSGPRMMIREQLEQVSAAHGFSGGLQVEVSVPQGRERATRTFNPQLGIQGGISILGTSGIVEPRSLQALQASLEVEVRQKAALGERRLLVVPGNYGEAFAKRLPELAAAPRVSCANFIGFTLDCAVQHGFTQVLLVGHLGKLVKVAGGIMDTHSRTADCRREIFTAHAAQAGASQQTCRQLMAATTSDACLDILESCGLLEEVVTSLARAIEAQVAHRVQGACQSGAVFFTNTRGLLAAGPGAGRILESWKEQM